MDNNSGNFGKLAKIYKRVRPHYPPKVIKDIYSHIKIPTPVILDLGCGTGISTKQLVKKSYRIFGCDVDKQMINHAKKDKSITYIPASAEKLPFPKNTFDIVTMFTSFHWFTTKKALKEIRRVSKPDGSMCIVQPAHKSLFTGDHVAIISKLMGTEIKSKYSKRRFEDVLTENNFKIVDTRTYKVVNKYTLGQFLKLLQTYSIWNEVPPAKRKDVLKLFKAHFSTFVKNGIIRDTIEIKLICARNGV